MTATPPSCIFTCMKIHNAQVMKAAKEYDVRPVYFPFLCFFYAQNLYVYKPAKILYFAVQLCLSKGWLDKKSLYVIRAVSFVPSRTCAPGLSGWETRRSTKLSSELKKLRRCKWYKEAWFWSFWEGHSKVKPSTKSKCMISKINK